MCTIGAVSNIDNKEQRLSFLMKRIDGPPLEVANGFLYSNGTRALITSLMRQQGVNIGTNQYGLAATISYSDYIDYRLKRERGMNSEEIVETVGVSLSP